MTKTSKTKTHDQMIREEALLLRRMVARSKRRHLVRTKRPKPVLMLTPA